MANICTVSGTIVDLEGNGIEGVVVKFSLISPIVHGTDWIPPHIVEASTDANGDWTIDLIETETIQKQMRVDIVYPDGQGGSAIKTYQVTIPDQASESFNNLI